MPLSVMILRLRSIDSNRPPPPKSAGPRAVIHGEKGKVAGPVGRLGWSRCGRPTALCCAFNLLCCRIFMCETSLVETNLLDRVILTAGRVAPDTAEQTNQCIM